jgi:hypothetical protein
LGVKTIHDFLLESEGSGSLQKMTQQRAFGNLPVADSLTEKFRSDA